MSTDGDNPAHLEDASARRPDPGCGCSAPVPQAGPRPSRRAVLAGGAAIGAGALALGQQARARAATVAAAGPSAPTLNLGGMSVVLLGTAGGPVPQWLRNMTSVAVIVDGFTYIVDCGNGVVRQIVNAGIPYQSIQDVFITHLHPDHMFDYLPMFVCGRSIGPQPGFRTVVSTYGPARAGALPPNQPMPGVTPIDPALPTPGLTDTHNGLLDADAYWLNLIYIQGATDSFPLPGLPADIRDLVIPHDIPTPDVGASARGNLCPAMQPFTVFEDSRVKVTAILVNHKPVFPAYAYRFDTDHGSVVLSGDTTADTSGNMVRLATGADLLVHEAGNKAAMIAFGTPPLLAENLLGSHTDVTQLGPIAASAGVKALALNHLISQNPLVAHPPLIFPPTWTAPIARQYKGPIYVGQDLMRFAISSSGVTMTRL